MNPMLALFALVKEAERRSGIMRGTREHYNARKARLSAAKARPVSSPPPPPKKGMGDRMFAAEQKARAFGSKMKGKAHAFGETAGAAGRTARTLAKGPVGKALGGAAAVGGAAYAAKKMMGSKPPPSNLSKLKGMMRGRGGRAAIGAGAAGLAGILAAKYKNSKGKK